LTSRAVVVNLIGNTKTDAGLEIEAELDERGAVAPFGRNKGERGSICGLPALRSTWGLE
jgi:hypothetical protein